MPQFHSTDFFLEVAKGNIAGHSAIEITGENTDLPNTGVFEDIWDGGGVYVPPAAAVVHNVSSTLAADAGTVVSSGTATGGTTTELGDSGATFVSDGVAAGDAVLNDANVEFAAVSAVTSETELAIAGGMRDPDLGLISKGNAAGDAYRIVTNASTGASIAWWKGLSPVLRTQQEFVVMNGEGDVPTTGLYIRQHLGRVFGPGTTEAEGTITSTTDDVAATVSAAILNGNNQTLMTPYTVPVNKTGYIVHWWTSMSRAVAAASSHVHLRAGRLDGFKYSVQPRAITTTGESSLDYIYRVPKVIPGGSDIWVEANSNANLVGVSAGFEIILVELGA